eukprot:gene96-145_t
MMDTGGLLNVNQPLVIDNGSGVLKAGLLNVNQPLVIDNGSGVLKAGFAGDEKPKCVFPNIVGRARHERILDGYGAESTSPGDVFIGDEAHNLRGLLSCRYPMAHGVVENWNDMEAVWSHVYKKLRLNSDEHPVLLPSGKDSPLPRRRDADYPQEKMCYVECD